jgi:hypothetical protein
MLWYNLSREGTLFKVSELGLIARSISGKVVHVINGNG